MERYKNIQILRGVAILLIVISHLNLRFNGLNFDAWGAPGVSMFIMISGVLGGLKLYYDYDWGRNTNPQNCQRVASRLTVCDIWTEYWKRYKKFFPLHITTLILSLPLAYRSFMADGVVEQGVKLVLNVLCQQSWVPITGVYFSFNAVSWYLSITLYNAMVFCVLKKMKCRRSYLPATVVAIIVWDVAWLNLPYGNTHWLLYIFPMARCLEFLLAIFVTVEIMNQFGSRDVQDVGNPAMIQWGGRLLCISAVSYIILLIISVQYEELPPIFYSFLWIFPSLGLVIGITLLELDDKNMVKLPLSKFFYFVGNVSMEMFFTHQLAIRYASTVVGHFHLSGGRLITNIVRMMFNVACIVVFLAATIIAEERFGRSINHMADKKEEKMNYFTESEKNRLDSIASVSRYAIGANAYTIGYSGQIFLRYMQEGNVLEMGPAEGLMTDILYPRFSDYTVVDGAEKFVNALTEKYPEIKGTVSLFEEFESAEKYQNIILGHVLEHVEDPVTVLKKCRDILADGGRVLAAVPNCNSIHRQAAVVMGTLSSTKELNDTDRYHGHRRVYNYEEFKADFLAAGFTIKKSGGYWLKPLSNRQIEETWNDAMIGAFMKLGESYPDIAAEIYVVAE